jgi:hypothetical protein
VVQLRPFLVEVSKQVFIKQVQVEIISLGLLSFSHFSFIQEVIHLLSLKHFCNQSYDACYHQEILEWLLEESIVVPFVQLEFNQNDFILVAVDQFSLAYFNHIILLPFVHPSFTDFMVDLKVVKAN